MATLYALTAAQAAIEDALYENGGELTPELEEQLAETREALPAKIDGYNHILARLAGMEAAADAEYKLAPVCKGRGDVIGGHKHGAENNAAGEQGQHRLALAEYPAEKQRLGTLQI